MIDHLYKQWNIKNEHIVSDVFTGYESVYDKLDSYNKEQYDKDPEAVIDEVFNIYRSIGLVPIMAASRYYKKCHNIPQIMIGFLLRFFLTKIDASLPIFNLLV